MDRENVISNLEQQIRWIEEIECHQFPGWLNVTNAMRDTIVLLKEQEDALEQMRLDNTDLRNCNAELLKAQEAVVRCKDCKHGEPCKNGRGEDAVECFNIDVSLEVKCRNPNWFCADGESKQ